jgi:hypothetical protein
MAARASSVVKNWATWLVMTATADGPSGRSAEVPSTQVTRSAPGLARAAVDVSAELVDGYATVLALDIQPP